MTTVYSELWETQVSFSPVGMSPLKSDTTHPTWLRRQRGEKQRKKMALDCVASLANTGRRGKGPRPFKRASRPFRF